MNALVVAVCSIQGSETGLQVVLQMIEMTQKSKRIREVGPFLLGMQLSLKVTQV